jgi:hypothetical protein
MQGLCARGRVRKHVTWGVAAPCASAGWRKTPLVFLLLASGSCSSLPPLAS